MSVFAKSFSAVLLALPFSLAAFSDPLPPDLTYRPLPTSPFSRVKAADEAQKAATPILKTVDEPRHRRRNTKKRIGKFRPGPSCRRRS